jgi:hypothetical protein
LFMAGGVGGVLRGLVAGWTRVGLVAEDARGALWGKYRAAASAADMDESGEKSHPGRGGEARR